jgi:uncharacterized protein YlxW (UPF0749 family)
MSLLTEAAMNPVDPGYAEAAARRRQPGAARPHPVGTAVVALLAVLLGLGAAWAGRELRAPRPEVLQARDLLESEIEERNADAEGLATANALLGAEVDALSAEALAGGGEAMIQALVTQGAVVGTVAVAGPGLRVTLTDSPRAQSGAEDAADERVQDLDLQILVNGLWAAGAEAIAINGQRLTAVSAIRSAGEAILVDLVPLIGPYVVEAVGDPEGLQTALARTAAASHLALLRETYSIGVAISAADALELPASPVPQLRYATPTTGASVAPGGVDVPGSSQTPGEIP